MIWPWVERTAALPLALGDKFPAPDKIRFAKLIEWVGAMKQEPAVKASFIEKENHYKFTQSYIAGTPLYDIEL